MHIIIVTGLSGSGKTLTLNTLEDQNYSCIDNLPPELLPKLLERSTSEQRQKIAVGIDIRTGAENIRALPKIVAKLKHNYQKIDIVYLYADNTVIKKRYNETRRRHPLSAAKHSLSESLKKERKILDCVSTIADLRIDTSKTDIYQLSHLIKQRLCQHHVQGISLMFQSFGFKYSAPVIPILYLMSVVYPTPIG